jgi:hypothetical protein
MQTSIMMSTRSDEKTMENQVARLFLPRYVCTLYNVESIDVYGGSAPMYLDNT